MNQHRQHLLLATTLLAVVGLAACGKAPEVPAPNPPAAANVSDVDVTEHVKTALTQSESLKQYDISVVTLKGDVRLIGVLDNQSQVDDALRIARAAEGAHSIHDELTIKK